MSKLGWWLLSQVLFVFNKPMLLLIQKPVVDAPTVIDSTSVTLPET